MAIHLSNLINKVEPLGSAKYVEFVSLDDRKKMPGVKSNIIEWLYREGLRMDEVMNPLTLLTLGLYGEALPKQNGAPVRIVVPWKCGFKSAKSIFAPKIKTQMFNGYGDQLASKISGMNMKKYY
jgi:sulfoxide reductase catalytic subunit YedY